jgi:hypothetical protein
MRMRKMRMRMTKTFVRVRHDYHMCPFRGSRLDVGWSLWLLYWHVYVCLHASFVPVDVLEFVLLFALERLNVFSCFRL